MILTSHSITGAAVASIFPQKPILGFLAGFLSHFLLDAIPHWDYPLRSGFLNPRVASPFKVEKALLWDVLTVGSDILFGLIAALLIFSNIPLNIVLLGVFAGILPDALQVPFSRTKFSLFIAIQNFHKRIQAGKQVHSFIIGITIQAILIFAIVMVAGF